MAGRWTIIALFVAAPTAAFAAVPALHLGRAADVIDAVPMKTILDPADPSVDVKVTNQTGKEATLQGWLNEVPATAQIPARSAIVKLTFPAMTEGGAKLKLSLTADGMQDTEVHEVMVVSTGYGHQTTTPTPGGSTSPAWPGDSKTPSWTKTPKPWPSETKTPKPWPSETKSPKPHPSETKSPKPHPSETKSPKPHPSQTKSPKPDPSESMGPKPSHTWTPPMHPELPKTGDKVSSYVLLGGGLLAFGMFVLGLAWALGRRTASESATEG